MSCFHPIKAFKLLTEKNENGKSVLVFKERHLANRAYEPIMLKCNNCLGCRIDRSKEWAVRCVHEASLWSQNCFITLTFSPENLNKDGSLVKEDFVKFMKRLRKHCKGADYVTDKKGHRHAPIRYFHCGEYGDRLGRPHHHACLFNYDFPRFDKAGNTDKVLWSERSGIKLYRSKSLERYWPYGYCTVGDVTYDSAAYIARYITKKINGGRSEEHYKRVDRDTGEVTQRLPEYITMSRRPGIGKNWVLKYWGDLYPKDFVTVNGKKFRPPRFYDSIYDIIDKQSMEDIKKQRTKKAKSVSPEERTLRRLKQKENCAKARFACRERKYENDSTSL